jgi:paraquat-inducible protein B
MSAKPNYFKIGLFIIIAVTLIVTTVVIWGAGLFARDKIYFETYFDTPVTGLDPGAAVLFRGVKIGQVERISFVEADYHLPVDPAKFSKYQNYVRVLCSQARDGTERATQRTDQERAERLAVMIQRGVRLRLSTNILTGQGYLEGDFLDPNRFPIMDIIWDPQYLYVPSAPGEFSTIKDSIDSILSKLEKIDTEKIGLELENILVTLKEAIRDADVPAVAAQLKDTLQRIDKLVASGKPELQQSLENLREVSANLKDLTETLKRHPAEAIFSQPPPKPEAFK